MIPKILHQIWVGPHPIPPKFKEYSKTWQNLHPDWKYKLWTENNIKFPIINQKYYNQAKTRSEQKDHIMLDRLYKYGGLYVDFDYECLRNIDELLRGHSIIICKEADHTIREYGKSYNKWYNTGLLGSTNMHLLIKKLIDAIPQRYHDWYDMPRNQQRKYICPVCYRSGPEFLTETLYDEDIFTYPVSIFNELYARHDYESSWKKPEGII